ncbi:cytochrome c [Piscinibacter gummiphilus]|uniref:Cytochrome c n=1 Tax=Piscinibacter gummiphilus TaxID=946333 RepID=A0ABZ0CZH9_9BURK|nr:cytochrome c [Piscinibacter gummiphilus]WOB10351.1 cytochrome c [Piscinibacter gummiphilus]
MNKWVKRGGLAVLGLVALGASTLVVGTQLGQRKMNRIVSVDVAAITLPTDTASIERGRYLYLSRGCTECHGVDGAGKDVVNDGKGMHVRAPNITPGPGSVVAKYDVTDWVRTLRHGVKPDGRPAIVMPSEDYARLTDADLGAMVAYLRQMPPATGTAAVLELPPLVKTLYAAGVVHDAAEVIDHTLPPSAPVPVAASAEHGAYVINSCIGCHGNKLSGGKIPGAPPEWPAAANLTPGDGSAMKHYPTPEAFATMLKTGKRPDGSEVSKVMPFIALKEMNDTDVQAMYLHLKTLPPVAAGNR